MTAPELSLVLACYNEERLFDESCREILATLRELGRTFEIVFVDDCSRDATRELIARFVDAHPDVATQVILHEVNRGRGATVADGFRAARGRYTGYLDIDLEVHCRYIPSLLRALDEGAQVATVKRIYAFQLSSLDRWLMSEGYSMLVRQLLETAVRDTETGYKFFARDALLPLLDEIADPGWFWDTECMVRAERRGMRIVEIPGAFVRRYDKESTVQGLRDSGQYFRRLLAFRGELKRATP